MTRERGSGFGLGFAAIAALAGCLHCSDDGTSGPSGGEAGEAGESTKAGAGAGTAGHTTGNGGSNTAGATAGGTAPETGGAAGAQPVAGAPTLDEGGAGGAVAGDGGMGNHAGEGATGQGTGMGGAGGEVAAAGAGGAGGAATVVETEHYTYVFDSVVMPTSNAEANQVGFDLNGDTIVDNKFGKAMSSLIAMGFLVNPSIKTAVQNGSLLMLATLDTTSTVEADAASFLSYFGGNPSPMPCVAPKDCGHHLTGTASFTIAADNIEGKPTEGSVSGGVYRGLGGQLPMRFMFGVEKADILLLDAQVELSQPSTDGFAPGRFGGAIPAKDVDEGIYPAVHNTIKASVAFSCSGTPAPTCGCSPNTNGAVFVGALDVDHDCAISLQEVKANPTISGLFSLDLDRDHDQTADALSCAFAITGKRATLVAP